MMLFLVFIKQLELSPEHTGAYILLGVVYQEKKQFDLSIKSFEKCLEIMPNYAEAHLNLGLCYLLVGDYENGWREYEWRRNFYSLVGMINFERMVWSKS